MEVARGLLLHDEHASPRFDSTPGRFGIRLKSRFLRYSSRLGFSPMPVRPPREGR